MDAAEAHLVGLGSGTVRTLASSTDMTRATGVPASQRDVGCEMTSVIHFEVWSRKRVDFLASQRLLGGQTREKPSPDGPSSYGDGIIFHFHYSNLRMFPLVLKTSFEKRFTHALMRIVGRRLGRKEYTPKIGMPVKHFVRCNITAKTGSKLEEFGVG